MADDPSELIGALERDWRDALCARDMARLERLIHPRFVLIAARGTSPFVLDRDSWLEAIQRRDVVAIDLSIRDSVAFGDVMIGTVEARWQVRYLGRTIDDCVLLTDVWVRDDDRWQVVRRHSSPLPAGEGAGA